MMCLVAMAAKAQSISGRILDEQSQPMTFTNVVLLNRAREVIHHERVSSGTVSMTVVDARMVLKPAIEHLADAIILAHNHPSDNATPSNEDRNITKRIAAACATMGVTLLDHIIVCRGAKYYSFIDHGDM